MSLGAQIAAIGTLLVLAGEGLRVRFCGRVIPLPNMDRAVAAFLLLGVASICCGIAIGAVR